MEVHPPSPNKARTSVYWGFNGTSCPQQAQGNTFITVIVRDLQSVCLVEDISPMTWSDPMKTTIENNYPIPTLYSEAMPGTFSDYLTEFEGKVRRNVMYSFIHTSLLSSLPLLLLPIRAFRQ